MSGILVQLLATGEYWSKSRRLSVKLDKSKASPLLVQPTIRCMSVLVVALTRVVYKIVSRGVPTIQSKKARSRGSVFKMDWSNEVVLEFLDLYENEPVIWCTKHPEHKNRNAINDAWKRIEDTISVECSIKDLKKKKESLMSTFRPLLNKVKASSGTGSGSDEVLKPTWFAYEKMASFLQGICKPRNTQNTEVSISKTLLFEGY